MPVYFSQLFGSDFNKVAAWSVVVLLSFFAASFLRQHLADILMKIYRYFIQDNGMGL